MSTVSCLLEEPGSHSWRYRNDIVKTASECLTFALKGVTLYAFECIQCTLVRVCVCVCVCVPSTALLGKNDAVIHKHNTHNMHANFLQKETFSYNHYK